MESMELTMRLGARPNQAFWQGKRVLLTGHTGFKGGWLAIWLKMMGAKVCGIALPPNTQPNLFELAQISDGMTSHYCDIRDHVRLEALVRGYQPEIVLHLAAQALVRASYREPLDTFSTNIMGTANLLNAMRGLDSVRVGVIISTDKVYRNLEWPYPYREEDALGGHDPYSASKAASEIVAASYRDAFLAQQGVAIATARAGNVIGGGDWSEDRLVPDAVRAWEAGMTLSIRRPEATRPWQHVLEPLTGYMVLAERLWADKSLSGAWNFGPSTHEAASVRRVIELARSCYTNGANGAQVAWGDGTEGPHEAGWLALETAKTREKLHIEPRWPLEETVRRTTHWYRQQSGGTSALALCEADIHDYGMHEQI